MGGDVVVKFMENPPVVNTCSVTQFLASVLISLAFAPVKMVIEVSRKSVYLSKKCIEKMLFCSIMVGVLITVVVMICKIVKRNFNILTGKMPVAVLLIGCIILAAFYVAFGATRLIVYEKTSIVCNRFKGNGVNFAEEIANDFKIESELANVTAESILTPISTHMQVQSHVPMQTPGFEQPQEAVDGCFIVTGEQKPDITEDISGAISNTVAAHPAVLLEQENEIVFVDDFDAPANSEVLEEPALVEYKRRLSVGVDRMPSIKSCGKFSKEEVEELKQRASNTKDLTITTKLAKVFAAQMAVNDEMTLEEDIQAIPEDFMLFS